MSPLKEIFIPKNLKHLSISLKQSTDQFDEALFKKLTSTKILKDHEMKARVGIISQALKASLSLTYAQSLQVLVKSLKHYDFEKIPALLLWPYMQFIEDNGLVNIDKSMKAIYKITPYFTGEFAMRAFLNYDDKLIFNYIHSWSKDKNPHIRRLACESIRPNLPWGLKVQKINADLPRNIQIISALFYDESEYVRKSVANHLNDIARLDPKLFYKTIATINKSHRYSQKLIRQAARSLIKAGDKKILKLLGYKEEEHLNVTYSLSPKNIYDGDDLNLKLVINNQELKTKKILIEYIIYFPRKNGAYHKKIFRLSDTLLEANEKKSINKRVTFKKVTTRVHYPGLYFFSIQINGKEYNKKQFKLRE